MDPNSFGGKVLLSLIDKLLIGLAAAFVVLYYQSAQRESERLIEERMRENERIVQERIAVARVVTDVLSDQRSRLMKGVSDFAGFVDELKPIGTARGENATELRNLEQDLRGSIAVLETIDDARQGEETCEPRDASVLVAFNDSVKSLTLPLTSSRMGPAEVDAGLEDVLADYARVLEFARCLAIDTVHHEVAHIH